LGLSVGFDFPLEPDTQVRHCCLRSSYPRHDSLASPQWFNAHFTQKSSGMAWLRSAHQSLRPFPPAVFPLRMFTPLPFLTLFSSNPFPLFPPREPPSLRFYGVLKKYRKMPSTSFQIVLLTGLSLILVFVLHFFFFPKFLPYPSPLPPTMQCFLSSISLLISVFFGEMILPNKVNWLHRIASDVSFPPS